MTSSDVTGSMGPIKTAALERPKDAARSTSGLWALSQQQQVLLPTTTAAGDFTTVAATAVTPLGVCQRSSATAAAATLTAHAKDASGGASGESGCCCYSNSVLASSQHLSRTAEEVYVELVEAVFGADAAVDGVHPLQASHQIDLLSSWQQQLQQQQPAGHIAQHRNESIGSALVEFGIGGLLTTTPWAAAISADAAYDEEEHSAGDGGC